MYSSEKLATMELDPQFIQGIKLLHSTNKDSADQLRSLVDEVMRKKYGPSKLLANVLPKRFMIEETIVNEHSSSSSSSSKKKSSSSSSKHSSKSSKDNSPVHIQHDTTPEILQSDDSLVLETLDDLNCVTCKGMGYTAKNRLVECVECHSLYHQECHDPHIPDSQIDVPRCIWTCSKCSKETQVPKERHSPKPASSDSKSKESKKSSKKQLSKSQKSSTKKMK